MGAIRFLGIVALICVVGCEEDTNPAGTGDTNVTTTEYEGMVYDSTMASSMQPGVYNGSWFKYGLSTNDSFTVQSNIGYGWGVVETGTYAQSGTSVSFTPLVNTTYGPGGAQPVTPVRSAYSATLASDTLTIADYIKIAKDVDERLSLGELKCAKQ